MNKNKLILACNVGIFSKKAKFVFMAFAFGGYLLKQPNVALTGTALCFITVIAEAFAHSYIINGEWDE